MQSQALQAEPDPIVSDANDATPVDLPALHAEIEDLIRSVRNEAEEIAASWPAVKDSRVLNQCG